MNVEKVAFWILVVVTIPVVYMAGRGCESQANLGEIRQVRQQEEVCKAGFQQVRQRAETCEAALTETTSAWNDASVRLMNVCSAGVPARCVRSPLACPADFIPEGYAPCQELP